jgi:hypothetical protein
MGTQHRPHQAAAGAAGGDGAWEARTVPRPTQTRSDTPATARLRRGRPLTTLQPTKRQPATVGAVERGGRVTTARQTCQREGPSCQRPLSLQPAIHSRIVCDVPSLLHAHTQTKIRKCKCKFSRTHIDVARTHTRHLQSLDDDVLRHILQHHIWVCLIIPDSIERSHLICFTCSTLFLRLYWNRIWQRGRGPLL